MTTPLTATSSAAPSPASGLSRWRIDAAHSTAQFKIKHMMIANVKGEFSGISGELLYDAEHPERSRVEAAIDAATLSTREPQRDAHLKSPDFFDVERFPQLTFRSTRVATTAPGRLEVEGELSLHGTSRPVRFTVEGPSAPAQDPWGGMRMGLEATTRINRKDFGLTWNAALEAGGVLVGDEAAITLDVEFVRAEG